jgi:hypothetical protein
MSAVRRAIGPGAMVLAAGLAMLGCGGGVYLGVEVGDDDDGTPPSVSIAAAASTARAGDEVGLVAAAADASGIESVDFYRLDGNVSVLLGEDGVAPFEWAATMPSDGRTEVRFFARATDGSGVRADSRPVRVSIRP